MFSTIEETPESHLHFHMSLNSEIASMDRDHANIFGNTFIKLFLDFVFCAEVISHVTFLPGFARQDLF